MVLDFLKKANISDDTIKDMLDTHSKSMIYNLSVNEDNCLKIISFMREIGINVINELLLYKLDWFLNTFSYFTNFFRDKDIKNEVNKINEDYMNYDL